jgi:hypothetical protein
MYAAGKSGRDRPAAGHIERKISVVKRKRREKIRKTW